MVEQVCHELEINVPASVAWELYSTLRLSKLIQEQLSSLFHKVEIQGDGGLGTILHITLAPGIAGFTSYKEKFTKIDHEKRVKEAEVIEGGYLDLGFTLYRFRLEVTEKDNDSCIIKSTIEYQLKPDYAANASLVSTEILEKFALIAKNHLLTAKSSKLATTGSQS